jgi:hypothetical protein
MNPRDRGCDDIEWVQLAQGKTLWMTGVHNNEPLGSVTS